MSPAKLQKHKKRHEKTYLLLKAIHEGQKHTLANSVIAPLCAAGLVEIEEYKPNGYSYKKCKLTYGELNWLNFESKQRLRAEETKP